MVLLYTNFCKLKGVGDFNRSKAYLVEEMAHETWAKNDKNRKINTFFEKKMLKLLHFKKKSYLCEAS